MREVTRFLRGMVAAGRTDAETAEGGALSDKLDTFQSDATPNSCYLCCCTAQAPWRLQLWLAGECARQRANVPSSNCSCSSVLHEGMQLGEGVGGRGGEGKRGKRGMGERPADRLDNNACGKERVYDGGRGYDTTKSGVLSASLSLENR